MGKFVLRSLDGYSTSNAMATLQNGGIVKFMVGNGENNTTEVVPLKHNDSNNYPYAYTFRLTVRHNPRTNVITIKPKVCAKFTKEFGTDGAQKVIDMFLENLTYRIIR